MRTNHFRNSIFRIPVLIAGVLLFGAVAAFGQVPSINLTAMPTTTTLPDGTTVPMWGYFCGVAVPGSTASCAALNPKAPAGTWSPVVITVPTGQTLTINLTNQLSFLPAGSATANNIPTSLTIVGQLGGGLGTGATNVGSPVHNSQVVTWSTVGASPGFFPPPQGQRVQSFGTEVAVGATATALTWTAPRPGTYLLESGTHPSIQGPMGLYGAVVVTCPPGATACTTAAGVGTAYPAVGTSGTPGYSPAVTYNAEVPMLMSEIDPVQNNAVNSAVTAPNFTEMAMRTFGDQVGSITVTSGGSGYTGNPLVHIAGASGAASGAAAAATVGAVITAINVTAGGSGYTAAPAVTITDTGTPITTATATATVTFTVASVGAPTAGTGTGYVVGNVITLTGGGGFGATATVASVSTTGGITGVTVTSPGSGYTSAPAVTNISSTTGTGAVLSMLTPVLATTGSVTAITVTNGGAGYTAPTITIAGTGGATASATLAGTRGVVYSVTLTTGGSGYSATPAVTIDPPPAVTGNTPATAIATISQACAGGVPCYPSAVNYTPLYYTFNGVAFSKTNPTASWFPTIPSTGLTAGTGTILVRLVNAGLRMHVPSIVNSLTTGPNPAVAGGTTPGVGGFALIAEDGNPLPPQAPRVQTEVFMPAGKTFDVMINVPAAGTTLPIYDRELSLSGNATSRDAGMLAYIGNNSATAPTTGVFASVTAVAMNDMYNSVVPCAATATSCTPLVVSDPGKGVIANDTNVYGVKLSTAPGKGTLTFNANGTFTYVPNPGWTSPDTFVYQANGTGPTATVTLGSATIEAASGITVQNNTFNASLANYIAVKPPGILTGFVDAAGYPLTVDLTTVGGTGTTAGLGVCSATVTSNCVNVDPNGGFTLAVGNPDATTTAAAGGTFSFTFKAKNSQGTQSTNAATATVIFPGGSGLVVKVVDGKNHSITITDYRWIIEEDQTFLIDPQCTTNPPAAGCPTVNIPGQNGQGQNVTGIVPTLGVNFHSSHMPYVALGCTGPKSCEYGQMVVDNGMPCLTLASGTTPATPAGCSPTAGQHFKAVCDVGNGACRPDPGNGTASGGGGKTWVYPSQVHLDPQKRYYISVLPGDAADVFYNAGTIAHGMGGAPIAAICGTQSVSKTTACPATYPATAAVTVLSEPSPYPPGELSVFVYEDDFPLNGEHDGSSTVATDALAIEPGLGGFQIHLWDAFGGNGDFTGQMSYDMFNNPLSNYLDGTIDPVTTLNACPITTQATGYTGMIVTCPKFESDNKTLSPLAGQAVVKYLMPGRWGVIATPAADRIARGEEWLQTNTLDGQKAHDVFTRIYEPSYFQEYGPSGFHVSIGFANPAIINARRAAVCNNQDPTIPAAPCNNTITGRVVGERLSRTPDERLYGSGSHDAFNWTQCYVSFGDPDGEDFAFTKCDQDGNFTLTGLPDGANWRITTFDQWNDQLVDGLSTPVALSGGTAGATYNVGDIAATQWQTNMWTRTFVDDNKDGIWQSGETGIPFLFTAIRLRDGSLENQGLTDFTGALNFNETFPLFSWYTVETDTTRYKNTGTHVVYDAGGPADGSTIAGTPCTPAGNSSGYPPCGASTIAKYLANTAETVSLPNGAGGMPNLRVPGAVYCANADCTGKSILAGPGSSDPPSVCTTATTAPFATTCSTRLSTGRIDPPWVGVEGWQGFPGQNNFIEFGKEPYVPGENGGITGHVVYASTRPFDDPMLLVQTQWTPLIPHVTMNLYEELLDVDGVTPTLKLVDTTQTSSFDEWAQGFRAGSATADGVPYMNCPGQGAAAGVTPDLFFFSLYDQPQWLDFYNSQHGGPAITPLPYNAQFKCYDGMHNWNQIQPAPYDGIYAFPSVNSRNNTNGAPAAVSAAISAISASGSTVTVATSHTHGLISGALVTIAGAPAGYNSTNFTPAKLFAISVTGPKSFTYTLPSVPTAGLSAGTAGTVTANPTNCTICILNTFVPTTDLYHNLPMLPSAGQTGSDGKVSTGKYVVEVVPPPGYELVKEEDKNILIGDNFIAPTTQVYPSLGNIFILPDQAAVASWWSAGQNQSNNQNPTNSLGTNPNNNIVPGFVPEPTWPCVGELRTVPDYISLYPQSSQVSPFAGASRRLCDRKEVTLGDQTGARAKFWLYTSTHIASKFTGGITDDYTSEFDPFSPQFGEKFAPPNLPVSVKDWTGQEISRVYADHWGAYNGMTYSTWEVNPPNPTGYAPTMMVFCMNDPGPILDQRPTIPNPAGTGTIPNPTLGQMIQDPQFTAGYSQFCYELPFMPGTTQYLDTPVVPTSAFAGAGYNNVDCYYPDATPAIKEVHSSTDLGPYVSAAGQTLTITALGDQMVPNSAYSGPGFSTAPYNQKYIKRHYGFGATTGSVSIGGVNAPVVSGGWNDQQITVTVPSGVPACPVQQQSIYGGSAAQCGELVILTAAATGTGGGGSGGSVTGVTITVPGSYSSAPTVTFNGGGGSGANGTAVLAATAGVSSVAVTNGGTGYTSAPGVTFTGGGTGASGAAGTANMHQYVASVAITAPGGTYPNATPPTVTFTNNTGAACGGTGTTRAQGTAVMSAGPAPFHVTSVTVTTPGNYPLGCAVAVTFSGSATTRATGSTVTRELVFSVTVTAAGSGYTSAPTVGFTDGGGTGATATATMGRGVASVTINSGGSYTGTPTVTFSCTNGQGCITRAMGTATMSGSGGGSSPALRSIDTVTVTIGGKAPTHVAPSASVQAAIDGAMPGDLIIIDPTCTTTGATPTVVACTPSALSGATATAPAAQSANATAHSELLLMWKPVRLQGVGAATSVINGSAHPAGKLDVWRRQVNCLMGLTIDGAANNGTNYDPTSQYSCPGNANWYGFNATPTSPQVDRLPLEAALGWDANLNGNLAELLQEPALMGALEGAAITVLSKGVDFHGANPYDPTLLAGFPTGTTLLQNTLTSPSGAECLVGSSNPFPSNFMCNPSSIDGLGITQSSQGGGGIFIHGWGHNIVVANNRIFSNAGTLSGGINVGQGEFAPPYIQNGATNAPPGSCEESPVPNIVLPWCQNVNVDIHNNWVSLNSSVGDELFSATPAGAGGVSICTGADYYKFQYNWVCGNLSNGDGGGLGHLGFSSNGDIEHNTIIFNQSTNPTIPANGGGIIVMGTPDADPTCGINTDQDCVPPAASVGPSDGVGPGLVINANLIMGNAAESGTGGGVAFQAVNGSDMVAFPRDAGQWNAVTFTNNIVVNNVAGWDGAGISLEDSTMVNIINNTIAYNSSTASAGTLLTTLGASLASQPPPTSGSGAPCTVNCGSVSKPQIAGVVAIPNSAILKANLALDPTVICPPGHFQGTTATNGACKTVSYPLLENNIIWQNSSLYIGVGAFSSQFQQNVISLFNSFTGSTVVNQTTTGACVNGTQFWDLGVRGDTTPGSAATGNPRLHPTDSVLSSGGYSGNSSTAPSFVSPYCNGSRIPPEACNATTAAKGCGWNVPPGIADATVPNPVFNLTPVATVDEGNNWVNLRWGPLSLSNPTAIGGAYGNYGGGLPLGNYSITGGTASVTGQNFTDAPSYDFFNRPRKTGGGGGGGSTYPGAVIPTTTAIDGQFTLSSPLADFGLVPVHSPTTLDQDIVVTNSDIVPVTITGIAINCSGVAGGTCNPPSYSISPDPVSTCVAGMTVLGAGESCIINVVFNPTSTSQAVRNASLQVTAGGATQTTQIVSLTGHDTIATSWTISPITPPLNPATPSTVAITGTITIDNTTNPNTFADAGPIVPYAITLTPVSGTGTFALGGTCAVGSPINAGFNQGDPGSSCTITITYTPPAGATGTALNGSARLTVNVYGTASTAPFINAVYNAN
jgi:hypothetical protein